MDVPIFPLHTVLCPGVALPLHIFEPRYREMVGRCLADGSAFGVVLIREGQETGANAVALASVGTMAEIREASRYSDGRFDLLAVGTQRFELRQVTAGLEPYLVGRIEPLDESLGDAERARSLAMRVSRRFIRYLELMQPQEGEDAEELDVRVEVDVAEDDDDDAMVAADADDDGDEADDADQATMFELTNVAEFPRRAGARRASEGDEADDEEADDDEDQADEADEPASVVRRIRIPDDPTVLSHLMSGIVQVELPRRQALLEADTTEERLEALDRLLDRELELLGRRLRAWTIDRQMLAARRN